MIKLFIVGIPRDMATAQLKTLLSDFGDVHDVTIVTEQETGQSKGYAFADFMDAIGARLAIKELDGSQLEGRMLNVRLADRQPRPRRNQDLPVHERHYEKVKRPRIKGR